MNALAIFHYFRTLRRLISGQLVTVELLRFQNMKAEKSCTDLGCPRSLTFLMFSPKLQNRKSTFGQLEVREKQFLPSNFHNSEEKFGFPIG